jgi:type IV secretory pathway VirJ component
MRATLRPGGKSLPLRACAFVLTCLSWAVLPGMGAARAESPAHKTVAREFLDHQVLAHGRFKQVRVFRPTGPVTHVALFLSGDAGWTRGLGRMAATMVADGALVIGIDLPEFYEVLEGDGGSCVFPDGDLENLSHWVQAYYKLPTYFTPLLVGYSAGASLAYAVLAQAPPGIFAGAVSLSFCADLDLHKPLCKGDSLRFSMRKGGAGARLLPSTKLHAPWVALHGTTDDECPAREARDFVAKSRPARYVELPEMGHRYERSSQWLPQFRDAYTSILEAQPQSLPAPPQSLEDLPIIEVPAVGRARSDLFAVLLSGDGGWAGLDKEVAAALAQRGVPVAGIDSLRYFWHARTPEGLADDIDRTMRYYASRWDKKRAILIGYSQGADVMPFAVNRLPEATRPLVALTALIGISQSASFEFHVSHWLGGGDDGLPTRVETDKLSSADTVCLYGDDDSDSLCPTIGANHARVVSLRGGHHFGGDYAHVADLLVKQAGLH